MGLSFSKVSTNDGINAIATTAKLLDANPNRYYASFQNDGSKKVYLGLGVAAEVEKGVVIQPGAIYELSGDGVMCTGQINVIGTDAGPQVILVQEV